MVHIPTLPPAEIPKLREVIELAIIPEQIPCKDMKVDSPIWWRQFQSNIAPASITDILGTTQLGHCLCHLASLMGLGPHNMFQLEICVRVAAPVIIRSAHR